MTKILTIFIVLIITLNANANTSFYAGIKTGHSYHNTSLFTDSSIPPALSELSKLTGLSGEKDLQNISAISTIIEYAKQFQPKKNENFLGMFLGYQDIRNNNLYIAVELSIIQCLSNIAAESTQSPKVVIKSSPALGIDIQLGYNINNFIPFISICTLSGFFDIEKEISPVLDINYKIGNSTIGYGIGIKYLYNKYIFSIQYQNYTNHVIKGQTNIAILNSIKTDLLNSRVLCTFSIAYMF